MEGLGIETVGTAERPAPLFAGGCERLVLVGARENAHGFLVHLALLIQASENLLGALGDPQAGKSKTLQLTQPDMPRPAFQRLLQNFVGRSGRAHSEQAIGDPLVHRPRARPYCRVAALPEGNEGAGVRFWVVCLVQQDANSLVRILGRCSGSRLDSVAQGNNGLERRPCRIPVVLLLILGEIVVGHESGMPAVGVIPLGAIAPSVGETLPGPDLMGVACQELEQLADGRFELNSARVNRLRSVVHDWAPLYGEQYAGSVWAVDAAPSSSPSLRPTHGSAATACCTILARGEGCRRI